MKFAVLGSAGQLGRDLCPRLSGDVIPLTRADVDLSNHAAITELLGQLRPDVVVNCAAYNFVDRAEQEPEAAFVVNAWGVRALASACRQHGCLLAHFSTDYVFGMDTGRTTPYHETDPPGPVSVYGLSKLVGEYLVEAICPRHFIIRTCGLYGVWGSGGKGGNFVETMLRVGTQGKPLRVVADQKCTPSYTADIATAAAALLTTKQFGRYHLTNRGACSWYEFATSILDAAGIRSKIEPIRSDEFGAIARRPPYSVLACQSYEQLRLPPMRMWQEALVAYLNERSSRKA